ncbi:MAG TPA: response regulator transcription factor [Anaerolineaceae bacterium]|nr:response regulator transcription factor [Anaerolineaceae bacterium]
MDPIRILLVDDHKLVREGTHQLLDEVADFSVVGEAADGLEALDLIERLRPDVVVMDVRMPRLNGIEATHQIKEIFPETEILILSAYEDDCYVFPLLEAGANGYLLKTASGKELEQAIRTIRRGEMALDSHIANRVVQRMNRKQLYRSPGMCEGLTERELTVLKEAASGKSNKEIGKQLNISSGTVQVHLRNIYNKMGVSDRTEAVSFAMRQGWISLTD